MDYHSARFRGGQGAPTMFICLAICATCACHLVPFMEESLLVGVINYYQTAVFV